MDDTANPRNGRSTGAQKVAPGRERAPARTRAKSAETESDSDFGIAMRLAKLIKQKRKGRSPID